MLIPAQNTKFCWICGKDITLEHSKTDQHGLSVHVSCQAKREMLKAATTQTGRWERTTHQNEAA